jgi:hypothetical protein
MAVKWVGAAFTGKRVGDGAALRYLAVVRVRWSAW